MLGEQKSTQELQTASGLCGQRTPGVSWCTAERLVERCVLERKDVDLQNESF
jgi:hypothetical protein